ncbi:MAG: hypothetical protein U9R43_16145 [Thermodesulfobacteriota bacterium]|nr:hypothetical protein [Thermodesulfobacteriota bacterium]
MVPEKITIKLVKVKYFTSRKGLTFSSEDWRVMVLGNKVSGNFNGVVKNRSYQREHGGHRDNQLIKQRFSMFSANSVVKNDFLRNRQLLKPRPYGVGFLLFKAKILNTYQQNILKSNMGVKFQSKSQKDQR